MSNILNNQQEIAYQLMKEGKNVFITSMAGCGKTFLLKLFVENNRTKKIGITSTTGTSALLIGGTTLHSYCGIGLGKGTVEQLADRILGSRFLTYRWKKTDILIIDEVSMLSPELFDKLENIARIVRENDIPFGGIQLILTGDFLQLPCVGSSDNFCFEAKSWEKCIDETVYLTEIVRQTDVNFQRCLNNIRIGNITDEIVDILNSRVGIKLTNDLGIKPTKIFSHNIKVDTINNQELDKLASDGREFYEYDMEIITHTSGNHDLDKYKKYCTAPESIQLTTDAQVMLLYNMDIGNGLVNGSRGVIIGFIDQFPVVRFLNGIERIITHYIWEVEENDKKIASIIQIPLRVAFAVSIHKVQGVTLDYAEIDLSNVFEYSQAYVAISRIKSLEGLSITKLDINKFKVNPKAVEYYRKLEMENRE